MESEHKCALCDVSIEGDVRALGWILDVGPKSRAICKDCFVFIGKSVINNALDGLLEKAGRK